jgi:hypothetical protein
MLIVPMKISPCHNSFNCACASDLSYAVNIFTRIFHPSISALFIARNSLKNFNGFSGSFVAKCFIASSKCGVTCWFKYTRVGLPCGIGCVGAC